MIFTLDQAELSKAVVKYCWDNGKLPRENSDVIVNFSQIQMPNGRIETVVNIMIEEGNEVKFPNG